MRQTIGQVELVKWAHTAIQRARDAGLNEDSYAELKSEWPTDYEKTARQLAGQANAVSPEPFRWLIGIREDGTVVGARREELSRWYAQVRKCFHGPYPKLLRAAVVATRRKPVVAMFFGTDDAPYLVNRRNEVREIPWREANSTRSATRAEILSLMKEALILPEIDFLSGSMHVQQRRNLIEWRVMLKATFFVRPTASKGVVIPLHHCSGSFWIKGRARRKAFYKVSLTRQSKFAEEYRVVLDKAEALHVRAEAHMVRRRRIMGDEAQVELVLRPANCAKPLILLATVPFLCEMYQPPDTIRINI